MKHNEIILRNQAHPRLEAATTTSTNQGTSMLHVDTGPGFIQIGPGNGSHCHIQTDISNFYFNKELRVDSGVIGSYNEDLYLRRATNSSHQIQISTTSITNSLSTTINGALTVGGTAAGTEGGEIHFTYGSSTTLSGSVLKNDLAGNTVRWFENSGNTRGAYIDINACGNNATSKIWHSTNDGIGSGLDADTVDTLQASQFLRSDANDTATGRVIFQANVTNNWDTMATATGNLGSIEIRNSGVGNDAFMAFHGASDYAVYFGIDADTNKLAVGGWSLQANKYAIYHEGNKPSLADLGYTGATNANYVTNNNQLTNGAGYITGNLTGKLTMAASGFSVSDAYHSWKRAYVVTATSPQEILYHDGTSLDNGGVYRFTAHISSTGTDNSATAVFWNQNGTWKVNVTGQSGTASNHPEFIISSSTNKPTIHIDHSSTYTVHIYHEWIQLNESLTGTDNAGFAFGTDAFLGSVNGELFYTSTGTSSTGVNSYDNGSKVFHDGYHPNADTLTTARTINGVSFNGSANITVADSTKLPLTGGTMTGGLSINTAGNAISISTGSPQILFNDTTSGADDFWIHVNSNKFYILADRDDSGGWETPHPFELNSNNNIGYAFGSRLFTESYHPNADTLTTTRSIAGTYFNGSANIDINYNNLTNKPTIPTNNSQLTNGAGYQTSGGAVAQSNYISGSAFATTGSPSSVLEYQQATNLSDTKLAPSTDWYNTIRMGHGNPYSYYSNTMAVKMTGTNVGQLYIQTISSNTAQGWRQVWDSTNFPLTTTTAGTVTGGTFSGTVNIATLNVTSKLSLDDYDTLNFGNSDDAEMFFNGSNLFLDLNSAAQNFYIRDGTAIRYTFNDNGSFTATGNITAYSDIRLKDDIKVIEEASKKIQTLSGNTYLRNDLKDPNKRYGGLIAQEVELILPEAVAESEDGIKTVDYNAVVALLVEGIKELKQEIEDLKTQLKETQ